MPAGPRFTRWASPPTHAVSTGTQTIYQPWGGGAMYVSATYQFGTLDGGGNFVVDTDAGSVNVTLPEPIDTTSATLLANLFNAAVRPDPANPMNTLAVTGKPAGDFRAIDVDAICATRDPNLAGTVV